MLVINPEGTVTSVDVDYNRDGSIKGVKSGFAFENNPLPKTSCRSSSESVTEPRKKKKKGKQLVSSSTVTSQQSTDAIKPKIDTVDVSKPSVTSKLQIKETVTQVKKVKVKKVKSYFISVAEIELFFKDRIMNRRQIEVSEYERIKQKLAPGLKEYFIKRYDRYMSHFKMDANDPRKRKTFMKQETKKKAMKKAVYEVRDVKKGHSASSSFTLDGIARFSVSGKQTPDGDMVNGRQVSGASRKPKYGYARDRFGRVEITGTGP